MPPKVSGLFLLLPVATTGVLLATYLSSRPSGAPIPNSYKSSRSISQSLLESKSLSAVNPRRTVQVSDSRSVALLSQLSDEEILARFTKGFFNGWAFTPERGVLGTLAFFGRHFIRVEFTDISSTGPEINSPSSLSSTQLPEKHTRLFHGNFMVLDRHLQSPDCPSTSPSPGLSLASKENSYIDIGYGSDSKEFAGMHRFEVSRDSASGKEVTVSYSSVSCNPAGNQLPFPHWVFLVHEFYSERLFWDSVRGVLGGYL